MDITNIITSIIFSILDVMLIEYYLTKSLVRKENKKFNIYLFIELSIFIIINTNIFKSNLITFLLLFCTLMIAINKYIAKRNEIIKFVLTFLIMKLFIEKILYIIFAWIFDTIINIRTFHIFTSYRILLQFFFRYLELIIIIAILNKKQSQKIELRYFKILSIIFSIYFCTVLVLNNDKLFYFPSIGRTFIFVIVIYNIALIMFDRYQSKAEVIEKELLITKQNIDLEKLYIEEVGEKNKELREFRHNVKNKATIIMGLIQKNMADNAVEELENIIGEAMKITMGIYVDNVYVDTIIDSKVKLIQEKGFQFEESYGVISIGNIGSADLALAVGLALDNAIEAVSNITDGTKKISLDIRTNKNYVIMNLTNSIQPGKKISFKHTSKTLNKENHGFGVKKIKSIAETYDGEAKYEVYNDHVTLKLFMVINKGIHEDKEKA